MEDVQFTVSWEETHIGVFSNSRNTRGFLKEEKKNHPKTKIAKLNQKEKKEKLPLNTTDPTLPIFPSYQENE